MTKQKDDYPVLPFATAAAWQKWLRANARKSAGVQLRFYKKDSGTPSITYDEALDGALCFGWIDGQKNKYDDDSYTIRFTPRRTGSGWSQNNVTRVEKLIAANLMQPAGLAEVEAAQVDGRWERAYASPSDMEMPQDFLDALKKKPKALAFYESLNKANKYSIFYRITTAKKPETRQCWLERCVGMMEKGERFHP